MSIETMLDCIQTSNHIRRCAENIRQGLADPDVDFVDGLKGAYEYLDGEMRRGAMRGPAPAAVLAKVGHLQGYGPNGFQFGGSRHLCWMEAGYAFVYHVTNVRTILDATISFREWKDADWQLLAQSIGAPLQVDDLLRGVRFELSMMEDARLLAEPLPTQCLTQKEIAARCCVVEATVSNWKSRYPDFPQPDADGRIQLSLMRKFLRDHPKLGTRQL